MTEIVFGDLSARVLGCILVTIMTSRELKLYVNVGFSAFAMLVRICFLNG